MSIFFGKQDKGFKKIMVYLNFFIYSFSIMFSIETFSDKWTLRIVWFAVLAFFQRHGLGKYKFNLLHPLRETIKCLYHNYHYNSYCSNYHYNRPALTTNKLEHHMTAWAMKHQIIFVWKKFKQSFHNHLLWKTTISREL